MVHVQRGAAAEAGEGGGTTRGGEPHYAEALFSEIVALVSCNDISACLFVKISVCDLYAVYFGGV